MQTIEHTTPREALAWDVQKPFVQTLTVGAEHLDEFGHTNNVVYLSWLQDVAWAHSTALGFAMADYQRVGAGCVARRHELDYLAATFAGDVLHVATWVAENAGKLDMWRAYQIIREQDRKTVLRGRTQWICVDMKTGRPRRQPPEFVTAYLPAEPSKASEFDSSRAARLSGRSPDRACAAAGRTASAADR